MAVPAVYYLGLCCVFSTSRETAWTKRCDEEEKEHEFWAF